MVLLSAKGRSLNKNDIKYYTMVNSLMAFSSKIITKDRRQQEEYSF